MQQIFKYLQDPSWWFTVGLMGLLASLAASYVRDWISLIASRYSVRARHKRRKRLIKTAKLVRAIKNNPGLLIIQGIKLFIEICCLSFECFFTLIAPPIFKFYEDYPEYDPVKMIFSPSVKMAKPVYGFLILFLMLIVLILPFTIYRRIKIIFRVELELFRICKLSKSRTRSLSPP